MDYPVISPAGIGAQLATVDANPRPDQPQAPEQPAAQPEQQPAQPAQSAAGAAQTQPARQVQTGPEQPAQQQPATGTQPAQTPAPAQLQPNPDDQPLTELKNFDLGIEPGRLDQNLVTSFGKQAVELGLTPRQARTLAQWQIDVTETARAESLRAEQEKLTAAWGREAQANAAKVQTFVAQLDKQPGLEGFSLALTESGAASNALVVQGLYAIARAFGEDRAGAITMTQPTVETPLDGVREAFARARSRRP